MTFRQPILLLLLLSPLGLQAADATQPIDGANIYRQRCATCHEQSTIERMPSRAALRDFPPEHIVAALTTGIMQLQAQGLTADEIRAVALSLSSKPPGDMAAATPLPNLCAQKAAPLVLAEPNWNGWGRDPENTRMQPNPGLAIPDISRLKVKWAYAYPGRSAYGQPTVVGGRVFVPSPVGEVSSLDTATGCAHWIFKGDNGVRTALSIGALPQGSSAKYAAYFGDEKAYVYAVDADTGRLIWKTRVEDHVAARLTGAPTLYQGRLYVPVSSYSEGLSNDPKFECCSFRGSIVAVDAVTGKIVWKTYSIDQTPQPYKKNSTGTQQWGPGGGAIWSSPTIDSKRDLLYVGTGNSYTDVPTTTTDAVMALDLATGTRRWVQQVTPTDNFVAGCYGNDATKKHANCPTALGPDFDFGASMVLKTLRNGKQIIVAGQKSGTVFGLDPDANGKVLWQTTLGTGGSLGGIEWGMAADDTRVFVAVSDVSTQKNPNPGIAALKLDSGEKVWHLAAPAAECSWQGGRCARAQSGAVTAIPGAVFSGTFDGHLRAYAAADGKVLWHFDTGKPFRTVNGITASGGNIDGGGATIVNGQVFVNSGYASWSGASGRLLLLFTVDGK